MRKNYQMLEKKNSKYWVYSKYAIFSMLFNTNRIIYDILIDSKFEKYYRDIFRIKGVNINKFKVKIVSKSYIEKKIGKLAKYQGIATLVEPLKYINFDNTNLQKINKSFLLIVDTMNDPSNFGSLIRTCYAFSVSHIIVLERNMPTENSFILSAASGAFDNIKIYKAGNIINVINLLKKNNWWVIGLESKNLSACIDIKECEFKDQKKAVIVGSEHVGLRRLVRENCDCLVRIEMKEKNLNSLNMVNAATIALYELS